MSSAVGLVSLTAYKFYMYTLCWTFLFHVLLHTSAFCRAAGHLQRQVASNSTVWRHRVTEGLKFQLSASSYRTLSHTYSNWTRWLCRLVWCHQRKRVSYILHTLLYLCFCPSDGTNWRTVATAVRLRVLTDWQTMPTNSQIEEVEVSTFSDIIKWCGRREHKPCTLILIFKVIVNCNQFHLHYTTTHIMY